jgi:hypothetical protein
VAFIGVPVLIIARDNTNSRLFVTSGIIFVMSSLILLLIFVPKIQHDRSPQLERPGLTTHISGLVMGASTSGLTCVWGSVPPGSLNPSMVSSIEDESESGEQIFSNKTQFELISEVEALKRYIRLLRARLEMQGTAQSPDKSKLENDAHSHGRLSSVQFADPDEGHDGFVNNSSNFRSSDHEFLSPLEMGRTVITGHDNEKHPLEVTTESNSVEGEGPDATSKHHQNPESHPLSEGQP